MSHEPSVVPRPTRFLFDPGRVPPAALVAAGAALLGYFLGLNALGVAVGWAEWLGGGLVAASAGLNAARWAFRRAANDRGADRAAWWLAVGLPAFNLLLAAYAAGALREEVRAGRPAVAAGFLAAWSLVPAGLTGVRFCRWLSAAVVPADAGPVRARYAGPAAVAPPLAPFLPTDGH